MEKEKSIKEKKEVILGLDISTKTIGCCLLLDDGSEHGKILELTHVSPKVSKKISKNKDEILFIKVEIFRNEFLRKYKDYGVSKVVIEEPLLTSNNANTCGSLLKYNGMISLAVYEELGVIPNYISSYDARKYSFPDLMGIRKYGKNGKEYETKKILTSVKKGNFVLWGAYPWDVEKKSVIQQKVAEIFPDIEWLYGKNGELREENFDSTDSYVALLGQLNKERYGELEIKTTNIKQEDNKVMFDLNYWNKTEKRTIYLTEKESD